MTFSSKKLYPPPPYSSFFFWNRLFDLKCLFSLTLFLMSYPFFHPQLSQRPGFRLAHLVSFFCAPAWYECLFHVNPAYFVADPNPGSILFPAQRFPQCLCFCRFQLPPLPAVLPVPRFFPSTLSSLPYIEPYNQPVPVFPPLKFQRRKFRPLAEWDPPVSSPLTSTFPYIDFQVIPLCA